jgi:hypothetical protein
MAAARLQMQHTFKVNLSEWHVLHHPLEKQEGDKGSLICSSFHFCVEASSIWLISSVKRHKEGEQGEDMERKLGVVTHISNTNTWEVEANLRPAWATKWDLVLKEKKEKKKTQRHLKVFKRSFEQMVICEPSNLQPSSFIQWLKWLKGKIL